MYTVLCRNRVGDFSRWREVFVSHAAAHREAGLHLTHLWRDLEDPENVFFLFRVSDTDAARAFLTDPAGADAGSAAGVVDGEYHFLEDVEGY